MKQQILHKQEFDRIRLKYNLDNPTNAERIANMLSSSSFSTTAAVSASEFASTFGMQHEAVIFLEWIMIGVKFKEDVLDKNKGIVG
jgi:CheY-like chemotaxis protein